MQAKPIPLQNHHFGSKIKIPKNMSKSIVQVTYSCSVQKTAKKKKYIREMSVFFLAVFCKEQAVSHL